jgi:hypothetical protein
LQIAGAGLRVFERVSTGIWPLLPSNPQEDITAFLWSIFTCDASAMQKLQSSLIVDVPNKIFDTEQYSGGINCGGRVRYCFQSVAAASAEWL